VDVREGRRGYFADAQGMRVRVRGGRHPVTVVGLKDRGHVDRDGRHGSSVVQGRSTQSMSSVVIDAKSKVSFGSREFAVTR